MSEFSCKTVSPDGIERFIEPLVTVTDKTGKKSIVVNTLPNASGLALNLSYVVMAMGEYAPANGVKPADTTAFQHVTKRQAGTLTLEWLKALPADSTVTFYHPTDYANVKNFKVDSWTPIVSATRESMVAVADSLAKVDSIMAGITDAVVKAVEPTAKLQATSLNPFPVYYAGDTAKRAKSKGGKKEFTPITF